MGVKRKRRGPRLGVKSTRKPTGTMAMPARLAVKNDDTENETSPATLISLRKVASEVVAAGMRDLKSEMKKELSQVRTSFGEDFETAKNAKQRRKEYTPIKKMLKEKRIRFQTPLTRMHVHFDSGAAMYSNAERAAEDLKRCSKLQRHHQGDHQQTSIVEYCRDSASSERA